MLNCDLQRIIEENPFIRNLLVLIAFYFLFTVIDPNNNEHVLIVFGKTILVFFLFILATKSRIIFISTTLLILFADQILKNHIAYLEKNSANEDIIEKYKKIRQMLLYVIVAVIFIGALDYIIKQKRDHGASFKWATFFLGTHKCRS